MRWRDDTGKFRPVSSPSATGKQSNRSAAQAVRTCTRSVSMHEMSKFTAKRTDFMFTFRSVMFICVIFV